MVAEGHRPTGGGPRDAAGGCRQSGRSGARGPPIEGRPNRCVIPCAKSWGWQPSPWRIWAARRLSCREDPTAHL
eukprot:4353981-Alexandrium_andersonii.AAC.1